VNASGSPAAVQFTVRRVDQMDFPQPLDTGFVHVSDSEGRFSVEGVGRGAHLLVVEAKGWARAARVVDTSGGAVDGLEIVLRKGVPVRLEPDTEEVPQFLVTIRDPQGLPCFTWMARGDWPIHLELVPGRYSVEISDDAGLRRKVPLEVGAEATSLVLEP
jgi:hypothetical protein